jgi:hypothetical protein
MRLSVWLVPLLAAGGIGCSSASTSGSSAGGGTAVGGNGNVGGNGGGGGTATGGTATGGGGGTTTDGGGGGGGTTTGGSDGGVTDGGSDGGVANGGPGPWPLDDLTIYGSGNGLAKALIDANPDEGQNIWAAADDTLYVMAPGSTTFQPFTAADGLHIGPFTDPYGSATMTYITAIAAGKAGQVYVGYHGYETPGDPFLDPENLKELGNGDDVSLANGTLAITRLLFRCDAEQGAGCWENRSPRRIVYQHQGIAAGHSFWGFNHGVTHVLGDTLGDHVHPEVWYQPSSGTEGTEKLGEFYGIAVDADGNAWMAGRYAVGLQPWNPIPGHVLTQDGESDFWVSGSFMFAFTTDTADHGLGYEKGPTYEPAGYQENNRGAAVTPDGTLWLARLAQGASGASLGSRGGLVSWDPRSANYTTIQSYPQVPSDLVDVQADVDGTLWLVQSGGALLRFDPASGVVTPFAGVGGVTRISIDATVTPRAIYASMAGGLAVIRAK